MQKLVIIINSLLGIWLGMTLYGCQKSSSGSSDVAASAPATTSSSTTLPGLGTLNGSLAMVDNTGANIPAANATVSVASHPEYSAKTDAAGAFAIPNMVPGTLTIYAQGSTGASLDLSGDTGVRAAQFKSIVVAAGTKTTLPSDTVLTLPGSITGQVGLINNPQNATLTGINVYVPGTSFIAKTDASGNFAMSNIPAGLYDQLQFDQPGLTSYTMPNVTVISGQNTEVGSVYMSLSTGPSGQIAGIKGTTSVTIAGTAKQVLQSKTVTVNLKYDSRAVLMKVAHESAFVNVNWVPVASTYTFTAANNAAAMTNFATDGAKSVFVKFSDQNGLESSVYEADFIIDTGAPTISALTLVNGWEQLSSSATAMHMTLTATDSGTGVKDMMLCSTNNFPACGTWETYSAFRAGWPAGADVYAMVRDYVGNASTVVHSSINMGTYTIIATGSYATDMTLYKAESPFSFLGNLTFSGNLTIEPGVLINAVGGSSAGSGVTITVNGQMNAAGTSTQPITITESGGYGFGGFHLENSISNSNVLAYITDTNSYGTPFLTINGGSVQNNTVTMVSGMQAWFVKKAGYRTLLVSGNQLTNFGVEIDGGSSNTITGNTFNAAVCPAIKLTGGSTTTISYNSFLSMACNAAMTPTKGIWVLSSYATINNNLMNYTSLDTGASNGVYVDTGYAVSVIHNNLNITNTSASPTLMFHLYAIGTGSAITGSNNYYTGYPGGPSFNPATSASAGGSISAGTNVSAWPTTAGSNCVGSGC